MIAVVTFFEKNQQPGEQSGLQAPVSFQPLSSGVSAFEHCTNQLSESRVKHIYFATDIYKKEIEDSATYQKLCLTSPCSILEAQNDEEVWRTVFLNTVPELDEEDLLWLRGDLVIPFPILQELARRNMSRCITVYPEARPGGTQPKMPLPGILNGSAFVSEDPGGITGVQAFFIKSGDRKQLEEFYKEDSDTWELQADGILLDQCLSARCSVPVLSETGEALSESLMVVEAMEKPVAIKSAIQICDADFDADIYVRTEELSDDSRKSLYAYILSQTFFTLLSRDRSQYEETLLSYLGTVFFGNNLTDRSLLQGVKLASTLKKLRGKTTLDHMEAAMGEILKMPVHFAGTCLGGMMFLWIGKNSKKIYPYSDRKIIAESASELLVMLNVKNCEEVFSLAATALAGAGFASALHQLKRVKNQIWPAVKNEDQLSDTGIDRKEGPVLSENLRSTIVPLTKTVFDDMVAIAEKEKSLLLFAEQELSFVTGTFTTKADVSVSQIARMAWQDRVKEKVGKVQKALLLKVLAFCRQKGLDCWLKTDQNSLDDGFLFDKECCCLLMKPWDVDTLIAELPAFLTGKEELCTDITPFPSVFADVFLYRKNTELISRWNVDANEMPRQIGIAIQRLFPAGKQYILNHRKSLRLTKILAARQGYCLPLMDIHYVRVKEGLLWTCPVTELAEKRRGLLSLSPDSRRHWKKACFWDESSDAPAALGAENTGTVLLDDRELPYVLANKYPDENIWYKVKLDSGEEYILSDAKEQYHFSDSPLLLLKLPYWFVKSKIRSLKESLREWIADKQLKEKLRYIKAQCKRLVFSMFGILCRFGLCIPEFRRALKAYRNKYAGQRCFLIGNGPSLQVSDLELLKNEITFGCNFIHKIYFQTDWRPTFHCLSDSGTVRSGGWDIVSNLSEDKTTMIIRDFTFNKMPIKPKNVLIAPSVSMDDYYVSKDFLAYHYVSHATVMAMMVEAAMYMGFSKIYLLGVDATTSSDKGGNFTANYFTPEQRKLLDKIKNRAIKDYDVNKRRAEIAERQQMVYQLLRQSAEQRGINIYNATRGGALEVFERVNLDDVVNIST